MEFENNVLFWQKLDTLVLSSTLIVERKKGSVHPKYPNLVYPCDYGYLKDTHSSDMGEIDVFVGTRQTAQTDTIIVAVDVLKKDAEVKVLLGCTQSEELAILHFLNQTDFQKTIILRRGMHLPSWAMSDN